MSKNGLLPNLNIENFDVCESCIKGKITSKPFAKHWQSLELLELIHSNICGPLRTKTHKGMKYFITFIDDYSQYGFIYLIKHKFEALQNFKNYKTKVEKQLEQPIKIINNDRCGEYETFDELCKGEGIRHIYTMLYKPQENGIVERQ